MARSPVDTRSTGSVLTNLYGALTRVVGGLWSRYGGWGWSRIRMLLPGARKDWEREAGDPWSNSVVALAIAWLGNRFPRPRIALAKVARNGDHVPIARHAAVDLWQRPNRYYSRRTLEKAIGLSLLSDGNAYLYKVRDNLGRVCELWWIPHYRILPTWPSDGSAYIDGYRVWLDTAVYHLPPYDVLHIRDGIDPRNERLGISALKSNMREVCADNLVAGYTAALLLNSGVPSVVIMPAEGSVRGPDKDTADRMADRFVEEFGGDRTGRPLVSPGRYEVKELGFNPEQMALDKLPQNAMSRIAAATGVAAMSLALPDPGKTYSNLEEANRSSWGTVVAIQELIGEAVQHQLLPEPIAADSGQTSPGLDPMAYLFAYDYSQIQELQESLDAVHKRTRDDWLADMIRRNEAREQLGYDAEGEPGEVYYSEFKQSIQTAAAEAQAALEPPDDGTDDGGEKSWRSPGSRLNGWHDEGEYFSAAGLGEKRNYVRDSDGQFARTSAGKKPKEKPDSPGHSAPGGGGGGGGGKKPHRMTAKEKADRIKKGKPAGYASEKARRAAESQNKTDGAIQEYTKNNEHVFAQRMGGKSFPDNDPIDVSVKVGGKEHGIELKTITHGTNDKITMKDSAISRKVEWEKAHGTQMHTVVLDHRDKKVGGRDASSLHSGHEIYYKRGVGSFRIGTMHRVKDEAELKELLATPYDKLPAAARGPKRGTVH